MDDLRQYGLNEDCVPKGKPKATPLNGKQSLAPTDEVECPNCGCEELMQIEVAVDNHILSSGSGVGYYLGCPACPWASPMLAVANAAETTEA